jgi:hypothetical protein
MDRSPRDRPRKRLPPSPRGVLPKSISASDVGQTFLSAGSGDFPVPGFRVKPSALVREVGKLRNRQARKPALQIWATRPKAMVDRSPHAAGRRCDGLVNCGCLCCFDALRPIVPGVVYQFGDAVTIHVPGGIRVQLGRVNGVAHIDASLR